jgi:hypothetical protein
MAMLEPQLNLLYDLPSVAAWGPLQPRWSQAPVGLGVAVDESGVAVDVREPILSLYNVRYLIDADDMLSSRFSVLAEFPGDVRYLGPTLQEGRPYQIRLYENARALPRAFLVATAREADEARAIQALTREGFDPRQLVLLEPGSLRTPVAAMAAEPPIHAPVEVLEYTPQRVRLRVAAPRACFLFLSDTWYPGWRGTVDGRETPIFRANIAGRAVEIPAGGHEVAFTYAPAPLRMGLLAALAGLALGATLRFQARLLPADQRKR